MEDASCKLKPGGRGSHGFLSLPLASERPSNEMPAPRVFCRLPQASAGFCRLVGLFRLGGCPRITPRRTDRHTDSDKLSLDSTDLTVIC